MEQNIAYIRTAKDDGYQLANQKKMLESYMIEQGVDLSTVKWVEEVRPSPASDLLFSQINSNTKTIYVVDIDRISRNVKFVGSFFNQLKQLDIKLMSKRDNHRTKLEAYENELIRQIKNTINQLS